MIVRGRRVLLARLLGASWWFLPGGHVEPGEGIEPALLRELAEELGAGARIERLLAVVENSYRDDEGAHHERNHVFEVTLADGDPESNERHLEFHWLALGELATTDVRPEALKRLLLAGSA